MIANAPTTTMMMRSIVPKPISHPPVFGRSPAPSNGPAVDSIRPEPSMFAQAAHSL